MKYVVSNDEFLEFGIRCVYEFDVVFWGMCVVFIGGFFFISNVCVGKCFGIFVVGIYVYFFV